MRTHTNYFSSNERLVQGEPAVERAASVFIRSSAAVAANTTRAQTNDVIAGALHVSRTMSFERKKEMSKMTPEEVNIMWLLRCE